jgi:hypothetical protein
MLAMGVAFLLGESAVHTRNTTPARRGSTSSMMLISAVSLGAERLQPVLLAGTRSTRRSS